MNLPPPRRLAQFVDSSPDERQIDRVWSAIETRGIPRASRPSWRFAAVGGALAAAAILLFVLLRSRATVPALAGVVVESGSEQTVTLEDGTRATLRPGARLRYDRVQDDRVELTLERGEVDFDVRHRESRAFLVHASGVDLVDRGTRFVVEVADEGVRVSVETGQVDIVRGARAESPIALKAGNSWTNRGGPVPATTAATAAAPSVALPPDLDTTPSQPTSSAPIGATGTSARELLQSAKTARLAGRPRDAAAAFDLLRRKFRDDPRAGLAAFELGRLRLDSLGDAVGGAEALTDAIALAPGATFREDAEARLVEAFDRMHDGRCAAARRAYLARYPAGVHFASVSVRCP